MHQKKTLTANLTKIPSRTVAGKTHVKKYKQKTHPSIPFLGEGKIDGLYESKCIKKGLLFQSSKK
jgi:hypothetical protein